MIARVMAFGLLELAASSTSSGMLDSKNMLDTVLTRRVGHLRALKLAVAAARSCVGGSGPAQ